jgi:chemotaxis protein histidine kinase CheA
MATSKTTVAVEVDVDSSKGQAAVGSFKKQLKEATAELVNMSMKFGESSVEAQNAAKKVASLKDAIGDAKALADTFNPDKKFVALGGALQGATAGFSALQGAMGLFGSDSEELNKTLLKVQSAMALQQGISGVFGAIDSFKLLKTEVMGFTIVQKIVTAGQWLWNAAMAANPIGAIVAVVAALIAGIVALTSWLIKSSDAAKQNATQIKESAKALEEQKKSADRAADALKRNTDYTLEMLKASGATTAEIRKAEQALAAKAVVEARTAFQVAAHTREIESQRLAQMKANGATEENIKAQTENLNKYTENLNEQGKRLSTAKQAELDLIAKHNVQITQEQTTANQKELDANKEKHDKLLQQQKDFQEQQKQLRLQVADEINKLTLSEQAYNFLKLEEEYANRRKLAANNQELLLEIDRAYALKKKELLKTDDATETEQVKTQVGTISKLKIDASKLAGQQGIMNQAEIDAIMKKKYEDDLAAKQAVENQKAQAVGNALGAISNLIGQDTAAGKALGIAQALINTYIGASEAIREKSLLPQPYSTISKIASVAAILATGFKTVKSIAGVKVPKAGGGGGGASVPSTASIISPMIAPQAQVTRLDQGQINQIGNAASRAYVVESDVSNGQERINRLNRAARIN